MNRENERYLHVVDLITGRTYVNPAHIVQIAHRTSEKCEIYLTSGLPIQAKGSADEIVAMLEKITAP